MKNMLQAELTEKLELHNNLKKKSYIAFIFNVWKWSLLDMKWVLLNTECHNVLPGSKNCIQETMKMLN